MFVDPLGTITISMPAGWAVLPTQSSLTHLAFADWTAPADRRMDVRIEPSRSMIAPGAGDSRWETFVRTQLPPEATEVQARGPIVLAKAKESGDVPASRLVWIRGPRLCVIVRQQAVSLGGPLVTPELHEVLRAMTVPPNRHLPTHRPQVEWSEAMDAGLRALDSHDTDGAISHFVEARTIAQDAWLHGLAGSSTLDIVAAIRHAEATLALTQITGAIQGLDEAASVLYRCRQATNPLPLMQASFAARAATRRYIDEVLGKVLALHGTWGDTTPPGDPVMACLVRSRLFLQVLSEQLEARGGDAQRPSWVTTSYEAMMAFENALTAAAESALANALRGRFEDLPAETVATLRPFGISGEASLRARIHAQDIDTLTTLVTAGRAVCAVELATVSLSATDLRATAADAARRLASVVPSEKNDRALVDILSGYAGSLAELGDEPSLVAARALLAEAEQVLDRGGPDIERKANVSVNRAWVCHAQRQYEAGLPLTDRAIALATAAKAIDIESSARICRSYLLNELGRHQEALTEVQTALAIAPAKSPSAVHTSLAIAYHGLKNPSAALEEIRRGLAAALADNPLGDGVEGLLAAAADILEAQDPESSFAAKEATEILYDARRVHVGGTLERRAYDDSPSHRRVAARLVHARLERHDVLGALATADHHRARSLIEAGGIQARPTTDVRVTVPGADATLADFVGCVTSSARTFLQHWGVTPPLDKQALARIIEAHGRTIVLFHPIDEELHVFIARPGSCPLVESVVARPALGDILTLTNSLRRELEIIVAALSSRGDVPAGSVDTPMADVVEADRMDRTHANIDTLRRELHEALFSEVPLPAVHEPITIVPYRELSVIPLPILTAADGRDLVERHAVSVLPSLAWLSAQRMPATGVTRVIAVGDPLLPADWDLSPLPHAAAEVASLKELFTGVGIEVIPLIGPEATEARLRTVAEGARIVHLACHAAVREPVSSSRLFLAPSDDDDGGLLPDEIADLRLDGALVVLAACETGLGPTTADGVLSLGRAFLQAGACATLLSLWRAEDDVTSSLMTEFYRGLLGTADDLDGRRLDVAAALRRAQLRTRKGYMSQPIAWGPWLVVGDGGWRLDA